MFHSNFKTENSWKFYNFHKNCINISAWKPLYDIADILINNYITTSEIQIKENTLEKVKIAFFNIWTNASNRKAYSDTIIYAKERNNPEFFMEEKNIKYLDKIKITLKPENYSKKKFNAMFHINNHEDNPDIYTFNSVKMAVDILEYWNIMEFKKGWFNHELRCGRFTRGETVIKYNDWNTKLSKLLSLDQMLILKIFNSPLSAYTYFFKEIPFSTNYIPPNRIHATIRVSSKNENKQSILASEGQQMLLDEVNKNITYDVLKYDRKFVYDENNYGRYYSGISTMKKAERKAIMEKYEYEEIDFPSMMPNILYKYATGSFMKNRMYDEVAKAYFKKIGQPKSKAFIKYFANELKVLIITIFNCKNPDLQTIQFIKKLRKEWNKDFPKIKLNSVLLLKAVKKAFPEISQFMGTETCFQTVKIESETMRKIIMDHLNKENIKPYLIHDALYIPKEKVYKYTKIMFSYLSEEIHIAKKEHEEKFKEVFKNIDIKNIPMSFKQAPKRIQKEKENIIKKFNQTIPFLKKNIEEIKEKYKKNKKEKEIIFNFIKFYYCLYRERLLQEKIGDLLLEFG